jgi:hypothetical protein
MLTLSATPPMIEQSHLAHLDEMMQPDKPNSIKDKPIENAQTPLCLSGDISL